MDKDIIYVGGGNTKNLLALWRDWGLDHFLRNAWNQGKLLAGISAGSLCWFEDGITDSYGGGLEPIKCLGFLPGSNCPHYDGDIERRPAYQKLIRSRSIKDGIAADDGVALHFIEQELFKIVSSRPLAKAYKVSSHNENVEEMLETYYLGKMGK